MGVKTLSESTVSEGVIGAQIRRLKGFHGWEDWRDELRNVLWRNAECDAHAERIVNHVLKNTHPNENGFTPCPTPAVFQQLCSEGPRFAAGPPRKTRVSDCPFCGGCGWAREIRRKRANSGMPVANYEYAVKCVCVGGNAA